MHRSLNIGDVFDRGKFSLSGQLTDISGTQAHIHLAETTFSLGQLDQLVEMYLLTVRCRTALTSARTHL